MQILILGVPVRKSGGTFFNFDSLIYSINSNVLVCDYYNRCVKSKILDIIIGNPKYMYQNPTVHANILRAFFLREKYALNFSNKLNHYLKLNLRYQYHQDPEILVAYKSYLNTYPKYKELLNEKKLKKYFSEYI